MDFSFIERLVIKYLQDHPEVIERLIHALVTKLLDRLEAPTVK